MKITTKEQAFQILYDNGHGIPFDAIEFLYNHPSDEEIVKKIQVTLEHVNNNYDTKEKEEINNLELWYAIIAENHLDIRLLDSIINLVSISEGSDFLDEQTSVLIGLMGQKHGASAVEKTLSAIENILEDKDRNEYPYLYLFDILFYADLTKHEEIILRILKHPNNEYATPFGISICYAGFKSFIPHLKTFLQTKDRASEVDLFEADYLIPELESIIKQLEVGKFRNPEDELPYSEQRDSWKKYYQEHAEFFEELTEEDWANFYK